MTQPEFNDQEAEDKPLDPAMERVQIKLKRLLAGSSLLMLAGFIAVFAAIIYKINSSDSAGSVDALAATIAIEPDAAVQSMQWVDGWLLVLVKENDGTALLQIDPQTGRVLGRTEFLAR